MQGEKDNNAHSTKGEKKIGGPGETEMLHRRTVLFPYNHWKHV
jgi:hypothetical protein